MFHRKGRILKVRLGYNANSSSIAAVVAFFLWGAAAAAITINMISAVILSRDLKIIPQGKKNERNESPV